MLARIQECILYRGFSNGEILNDMTELINLYEADEEALKAKEDRFFKSVNGLVELAGMYGFSGALSRAASTIWQRMISRYSRNCMILTSRFLTKCSEPYAAG